MDTTFQSVKFVAFSAYRRNDVYPLPEKTIPYMDLTFCLEGTMEYYFEGKQITLAPGDAILYPPGYARHRAGTSGWNNYASFNVMFRNDFESPLKGHIKKCVRPETVHMIEAFRKEFESVSNYKQEKCAAIFSYLYHQLLETAFDTEHPSVKSTKQYIMEHLSEPICLERVAKHVHLAPNYLCSLFKKNTDMTIMEYITRQRIELAKRLIVTHDDALYRIAEECGFGDYNYFSHTFKKITGLTAVQYRKLKLKNY